MEHFGPVMLMRWDEREILSWSSRVPNWPSIKAPNGLRGSETQENLNHPWASESAQSLRLMHYVGEYFAICWDILTCKATNRLHTHLYSQTDVKTKKVWQGKMFSWVTIPIWDWTRKGQHILVSIPMIQFWLLNLDNRYWIKESELKGLVKEEKQ